MTDKNRDESRDTIPQSARTLAEKGGTYLLIADESPEFQSALRAAGFLAQSNKAYTALIYVTEPPGFQQWGSVEEQIMAEQRRKGEEVMQRAAAYLHETYAHRPVFFFCEGDVKEAVKQVIADNPEIKALILGAGKGSNPLISYFCGKGLSDLPVPLFVIPEV